MDTTQSAVEVSEVSFNRHNGFVGPSDLAEVVNIIGVGATGSNLALAAAKMGATNFQIWDHDLVEAHNLPNQAYDVEHIGMSKVDALEAVLKRFNPRVNVVKHQTYFTTEKHSDQVEGVLVIAVDSMKARADITNTFDGNPLVSLVMESRLGFDFGSVTIIDPMCDADIENWKASLLDDSEVPEGPCGRRICTTTVGIIANFMVQQICMQKSSIRRGTEWKPRKKMVMHFNEEGMVVHQF